MRVSSIILARGGSKGIPNKNIVEFCGKPLIAWTILQCLASDDITDVWVSSDSKEILAIAEEYGAKIIIRPDKISGDKNSSESAWLHALEYIEGSHDNTPIDYIIGPQVTSPIREFCDFSKAIKTIIQEESDSLLSVAEIEDFFVWKKDVDGKVDSVNYDYRERKPRQQIDKKYLENGSFYIFRPQLLKEHNNRLGNKISVYVMERYKMFQIDNYEDIKLCSVIMKGYGLDNL